MKLFFDTCAVIDYLCNRQNADSIEKILIKAEKESHKKTSRLDAAIKASSEEQLYETKNIDDLVDSLMK